MVNAVLVFMGEIVEIEKTNRYQKFRKMDGKDYGDVTRFLKQTTHLTAREWMIAHLCSDFRDISNHSQMTWIGENLPDLVPFVTEPYSRHEVSNSLSAFKKKVRRSGTTFFYAYYAGLISKEEMISLIHTIVSDLEKLMETEGNEVPVSHDIEVQRLITDVFRRINEQMIE